MRNLYIEAESFTGTCIVGDEKSKNPAPYGWGKVMGWNTLSEGLAWARENEAAQVDYSGIHHPDDKGETCEACNLDQYVEQ